MCRKRWQLLLLTKASVWYTVSDLSFSSLGAHTDISPRCPVPPRLWTLAAGLGVIREKARADAAAATVAAHGGRSPRPGSAARWAGVLALVVAAVGLHATARAGLLATPWALLVLALMAASLWAVGAL